MCRLGVVLGRGKIAAIPEALGQRIALHAPCACLQGMTDVIHYCGYAPVIRDGLGFGYQIVRMIMWGFTTPAMVYLLSLLSDAKQSKVRSASARRISTCVCPPSPSDHCLAAFSCPTPVPPRHLPSPFALVPRLPRCWWMLAPTCS